MSTYVYGAGVRFPLLWDLKLRLMSESRRKVFLRRNSARVADTAELAIHPIRKDATRGAVWAAISLAREERDLRIEFDAYMDESHPSVHIRKRMRQITQRVAEIRGVNA